MGFSCGLIGLPNVGKSTFFNALTQGKIAAENYPFCTIEPNHGVAAVPEERLEKIAQLSNSKKIIPTIIEFTDIAGLVKGAAKGEGLGNAFLSHIREVDAVVQLVRLFRDPAVLREGAVAPLKDIEIINTELFLADLKVVEKRQLALEKLARRGLNREVRQQKAILMQLQECLLSERLIKIAEFSKEEQPFIKALNLLCAKPMLLALNLDENELTTFRENELYQATKRFAAEKHLPVVELCSLLEAELSQLQGRARAEYLELLELKEAGVKQFIRACYDLLQLVTFITTGPEETRAWTIKRGTLAPQAAGVIHSDLKRGFIKAEVVKAETFLRLGSMQACREQGQLQIEGKNYVVQDGDICHFRFNS